MSVLLLTENELTKLSNTLANNKEVVEFASKTNIANDRKKYSFEDAKTTIQRAVWYGYVANRTAYNLQYQENELINFNMKDSNEEFNTLQEAIDVLGSLVYNIATNDGNVFLADEWSNLLRDIKKEFNVEVEVEMPNYIY
jgi:hypothetical protein